MLSSGYSINKDYIGSTYGFKNIDDLRNYINSSKIIYQGKWL